MATDCITQVTFQGDEFAKPVVARFDLPDASADGGLVLFKALDTELGLTRRLAGCLDDARAPGKVLHETIALLQQRVFGLCGGYADCNDAARLVHDPIHKLVLDRDPLTGLGLASQPTLSRFENAVTARELRAMTHVLADTVIAQHRRRLRGRAPRIIIDLDPTDDPTHGQQEFAFFNGHYDTWCYLPVVATVTFNDEPAQFAVAAVLRPGKAPPAWGRAEFCGVCCASCARPFPARRSACAWTAALPAPSCSCSWTASRSSTSWPWPAIGAWRNAPGG
jgi:DDE family transposase